MMNEICVLVLVLVLVGVMVMEAQEPAVVFVPDQAVVIYDGINGEVVGQAPAGADVRLAAGYLHSEGRVWARLAGSERQVAVGRVFGCSVTDWGTYPAGGRPVFAGVP